MRDWIFCTFPDIGPSKPYRDWLQGSGPLDPVRIRVRPPTERKFRTSPSGLDVSFFRCLEGQMVHVGQSSIHPRAQNIYPRGTNGGLLAATHRKITAFSEGMTGTYTCTVCSVPLPVTAGQGVSLLFNKPCNLTIIVHWVVGIDPTLRDLVLEKGLHIYCQVVKHS